MSFHFLILCQSFYYDKEPIMSNEEFDNLKEELTWEGSSVVVLSKDKLFFIDKNFMDIFCFAKVMTRTCFFCVFQVQMSKNLWKHLLHMQLKSNMSDAEFDALKLKLKVVNAIIITPYF